MADHLKNRKLNYRQLIESKYSKYIFKFYHFGKRKLNLWKNLQFYCIFPFMHLVENTCLIHEILLKIDFYYKNSQLTMLQLIIRRSVIFLPFY